MASYVTSRVLSRAWGATVVSITVYLLETPTTLKKVGVLVVWHLRTTPRLHWKNVLLKLKENRLSKYFTRHCWAKKQQQSNWKCFVWNSDYTVVWIIKVSLVFAQQLSHCNWSDKIYSHLLLVLSCVSFCCSSGVSFYVTTNCFWTNHNTKTKSVVEAIYNAAAAI